MPTTRRPYLITESDRLKVALDDAAGRWPEVRSRAQLLVGLAEEGHEALPGTVSQARAALRAAIERTSGALSGVYEPVTSRRYVSETTDLSVLWGRGPDCVRRDIKGVRCQHRTAKRPTERNASGVSLLSMVTVSAHSQRERCVQRREAEVGEGGFVALRRAGAAVAEPARHGLADGEPYPF